MEEAVSNETASSFYGKLVTEALRHYICCRLIKFMVIMQRVYLSLLLFAFTGLKAQFYYGDGSLYEGVTLWITIDDAINADDVTPARTLYPAGWSWKNIETYELEHLFDIMKKRRDVLSILPVAKRQGAKKQTQYFLAVIDSFYLPAPEDKIAKAAFLDRKDFRIISELAIDSVKYADPFYRYMYFKSLLSFTHRNEVYFEQEGTGDYFKWGVALNNCDSVMIPEPLLGKGFKSPEMLSRLAPNVFLLNSSNSGKEARTFMKKDIPVAELIVQERDSGTYLLKYLYTHAKGMIYFEEREIKPKTEPLFLKEDIAWFNAKLKDVEKKWLLEGKSVRQK